MSRIVVTGAAGFVGFHVAKRLLDRGDEVVGVDSLSPYYDVALKRGRLALLEAERGFAFEQVDLADRARAERLFATARADAVVHLAAQPGVRYSLENPHAYIDANVTAFLCVLEGCRHHPVRHLVYASSSSIYGGNTKVPFSVSDNVDRPISLYAATKKANELMAHTYSHLYDIPTTGLRFFTVYGPWGRPDMAYFSFTKAILEGRTIDIYNHGKMQRDFTYIDDVVEGIVRVVDRIPCPNPGWNSANPDPATSYAPYRIYNIGNSSPLELLHFIELLEKHLGKIAKKNFLPMQPGDVLATYADVTDLVNDVQFEHMTTVNEG